MSGINTIQDVVEWRLCLGCGACAWVCPEDKVRLVDFISDSKRTSSGQPLTEFL